MLKKKKLCRFPKLKTWKKLDEMKFSVLIQINNVEWMKNSEKWKVVFILSINRHNDIGAAECCSLISPGPVGFGRMCFGRRTDRAFDRSLRPPDPGLPAELVRGSGHQNCRKTQRSVLGCILLRVSTPVRSLWQFAVPDWSFNNLL